MILSVSRRTDIPAFYSDWFFNRISEGYVLVRNPMNTKQVSKIKLSSETIECIVFWTKDPSQMLEKLNQIDAYKYYFQYTLNSYDKSLEPNVHEKKHLIDTFIKLSKSIGKERVIWRYDPIILTNKYNKAYHLKWFEYIAKRLSGYTEKCVISYLDLYKKTERNMKNINLVNNIEDFRILSGELCKISKKYGIVMETCSESIDLAEYGIKHGKCIDTELISKITGINFEYFKDKNQREECGCAKSVDIGVYNTCKHGCLYCYANFNKEMVELNSTKHNPNSPLLIGELMGDEKIYTREYNEEISAITHLEQLSIFEI